MSLTALYRHFDDEGELLYVGISLCPTYRLAQHRDDRKPWFEFIHKITVEWFNDRAKAEEAERRAIQAEAPIFNVTYRNHAAVDAKLREQAHRADKAEAEVKEMEAACIGPQLPRDASGHLDAEWFVRSLLREAFGGITTKPVGPSYNAPNGCETSAKTDCFPDTRKGAVS